MLTNDDEYLNDQDCVIIIEFLSCTYCADYISNKFTSTSEFFCYDIITVYDMSYLPRILNKS